MKKSLAGLTGVAIGNSQMLKRESEQQEKRKELPKRVLGRTGFKTSVVGSGKPVLEEVLRYALESGVNYIDSAEGYLGGRSDEIIGNAIKHFDRKKLFITSKLQLRDRDTKDRILTRTKRILDKLKTDYVDCMMMHAVGRVETLQHKGFHEAMVQLKQDGRVKHLGVSHHGTFNIDNPRDSMEKVLLNAIEDGRFDVFLFTYNFLNENRGEVVLEECGRKNIGTTIMKSNPARKYFFFEDIVKGFTSGGKEVPAAYQTLLEKFKGKRKESLDFLKKYNVRNEDDINNAALKFTLDNKDVNTTCIYFGTFKDVDGHLSLPSLEMGLNERRMLDDYKEAYGHLYCRHNCGVCETSCRHNVPVNTIMRYNHYFFSQDRQKEAMTYYNELNTNKADKCADCEGNCEKNCPYGIPVQGLLNIAHENLTLA
ncbi:aldo/keto reductase [candidate division KSB1 bacterium]